MLKCWRAGSHSKGEETGGDGGGSKGSVLRRQSRRASGRPTEMRPAGALLTGGLAGLG